MSRSHHSTQAVVVIAVLAIAAGVCATWAAVQKRAAGEIKSVSLAHELEMTGLCANALTLVHSTEGAKLSGLLQKRLENAVRRSNELVDSGARLGILAPNLLDSARRAAAYYETQGNAEGKLEAERLLHKLNEVR